MRYATLLIFLLFISLRSFAQQQQQDSDKLFYATQAEKYRKMKSTGTVLTIFGGALAVIGAVTLANSSVEEYYDGYTTTTTVHGHPGLGAAAFLLGAAGLGSGIPLLTIGTRNERKYNQRLENLSVRFNANPKRTGLTLIYKF